jgi:hypothetical protein
MISFNVAVVNTQPPDVNNFGTLVVNECPFFEVKEKRFYFILAPPELHQEVVYNRPGPWRRTNPVNNLKKHFFCVNDATTPVLPNFIEPKWGMSRS